MKTSLHPIAFLVASISLLALLPANAGPQSQYFARADTDKTPVDLVTAETSYVFESDLNHGGSLGEQDEFQNSFEYGHRFLISGEHLYLRMGVGYSRLDFGSTAAPVPDQLQAGYGVIGFEYMRGSDVGAFLLFRPGFYTESDIDSDSFDAPVTLGRVFVLQEDKLYLFVGAYGSLLKGGSPILPLAGLVYRPNEQWSFDAVLPEPRITYAPSKTLSFWAGGEFVAGSYRTDQDKTIVPAKLSGTQVDYTDYRAGVGIAYSPCHDVTIDLGGGCAVQRDFKFHRAGENYRTDPAPYFRLEVKAAF